jgi:hypothetical protein
MEADHQEWKRRVLAGEIELAEIDTAPHTLVSNQTPSRKLREMGVDPALAAAATHAGGPSE